MKDERWTLKFDEGRQEWSPKNYKNEYRDWINLREAFIFSVNTVAARLAVELGINPIVELAKKFGIPEASLPRVPSLSLGALELSPIQLLQVYATLANRGYLDELTVIRGITYQDGQAYARFVYHGDPVIDSAQTDLMLNLMQDVFREGTASTAVQMGFDRPAAGKTGTTSDHEDSWFAGFTPQLTTVVWVGFDQGESVDKKGETKLRLSGAGTALPIWVRFMNRALEDLPPLEFPVSEELTNVRIDRHSGAQATFDCPEDQVIIEKYVIGKEPNEHSCEPSYPESIQLVEK